MLNNFKHFIIFLIIIFSFCIGFYAFAQNNNLVIVYPKNNSTIYANSTFFVGHTNPKSTLTINNEPVKVYSNGSFVRVFSLNKGENEIILKSTLNDEVDIKKINLTVPLPHKNNSEQPKFEQLNQVMVVSDEEAPLRQTPYGNRMTPVKKGVVVKVIGLINNHYKVVLSDNKYAYIGKSVLKPFCSETKEHQTLDEVFIYGDEKNVNIRIPMQQPVLTEIFTDKNNLKVRLHGTDLKFKNYIVKSPYVKNFSFEKDTMTISMYMDDLMGYDYFYDDDNNFVLKVRKPLKGGLRGKIIAIDAGHGGKECGSIGPTEVPEKNINLAISKYLKQELEKAGAKVIMTRDADSYVDLYERVNIAQFADADILISIHNNALPDGGNPYKTHGTTTYYYNDEAIPLAQNIQNYLVSATGFNDLGVKKDSFVLTRPTLPVSILIEVGFMINPYEYEQLLQCKNQKKYAQAIKKGLEGYLK